MPKGPESTPDQCPSYPMSIWDELPAPANRLARRAAIAHTKHRAPWPAGSPRWTGRQGTAVIMLLLVVATLDWPGSATSTRWRVRPLKTTEALWRNQLQEAA